MLLVYRRTVLLVFPISHLWKNYTCNTFLFQKPNAIWGTRKKKKEVFKTFWFYFPFHFIQTKYVCYLFEEVLCFCCNFINNNNLLLPVLETLPSAYRSILFFLFFFFNLNLKIHLCALLVIMSFSFQTYLAVHNNKDERE